MCGCHSPSLGYKTFFWVLIQFCPCKDTGEGVWQAKGWDSEYVLLNPSCGCLWFFRRSGGRNLLHQGLSSC